MKFRTALAVAAVTFAVSLTPALTLTRAQGRRSGGLPPGEGYDTLMRVCSDCHGLDTIEGQRHTRGQWQNVVDDMMSRGANGTDEEAKAIVDYLTSALGRVNVNRAPEADLRTTLELSSVEANAIVEYRTQHGEFKTIDDLKKVSGLDVAKIEGKKDRIVFAGQ